MVQKLSLKRDFTRFQNDKTFPHKVTVWIDKDRQVICSGAIVAQQSSVLEKKMREDNGNLILEEMVDTKKRDQIVQCFNYLHGADLEITYENIETILKFASWYEVEDLVAVSLDWTEDLLKNKRKKTEHLFYFLKIADSLASVVYSKLMSLIERFIRANIDHVSRHIIKCLHIGISGHNLIKILDHSSSNSNLILLKWVNLCSENKNFIIKNPKLFDFKKIFRNGKEFTSLIDSLESGVSPSVESMKMIVGIQKDYYARYNESDTDTSSHSQQGSSTGKSGGNTSEGNILDKPETQLPVAQQNLPVQQAYKNAVFTVYVGNIPPRMTTKTLTELLSKSAGRIADVDYYPEDNNALVTFETSESANKLLRNNGCRGFVLNIVCADTTEVHIGNVPYSATKQKLAQLLNCAGRITDVTINHRNSYAVICFQDIASANNLVECKAGNKTKLDGYRLHISRNFHAKRIVHVGDVSDQASKRQLNDMFSRFGKIDNLSIIKKPETGDCFAFVEFETEEAAAAVIEHSFKSEFKLHGKIVRLEFKRYWVNY